MDADHPDGGTADRGENLRKRSLIQCFLRETLLKSVSLARICRKIAALQRKAGQRKRGFLMIFVTGPLYAGKEAYICQLLGWGEEDFKKQGVRDVQELVEDVSDREELEELAARLSDYDVVIATEIGGGVVPIDPKERENREKAGRLSCLLAEKADTVIRVCCGLGQVLKGDIFCPRLRI